MTNKHSHSHLFFYVQFRVSNSQNHTFCSFRTVWVNKNTWEKKTPHRHTKRENMQIWCMFCKARTLRALTNLLLYPQILNFFFTWILDWNQSLGHLKSPLKREVKSVFHVVISRRKRARCDYSQMKNGEREEALNTKAQRNHPIFSLHTGLSVPIDQPRVSC